jgi:aminoglycoside phosphotransferase (APT) family kinase protein
MGRDKWEMPDSAIPVSSDPREARLIAWVAAELGAETVSIERQARWRPCWFIVAERDGKTLRIYVRARREQEDLTFFPLSHEAEIFRTLKRAGIPAPEIYGMCPDPEAIVMEWIPGRPDLGTVEDPAERQEILLDFITWLARVHDLDIAEFRDAGLPPAVGQAVTFGLFDRFEILYRNAKRRPEPEVEFFIGWLRRNPPAPLSRSHFITGDSGQFLFDNGRVTSLLDLELGHFGDPAFDLASLLIRDLSESLGDLSDAFRHYAAISGAPIDLRRVEYYIALWGIMTPMSISALARNPTPELDLRMYLEFQYVLTRIPLEAIASLTSIALEAAPPLPDCPQSSAVAAALAAVIGALDHLPPTTPIQGYRHGCAVEMAHHLALLATIEPAILEAEKAEAAALLGEVIDDEGQRDAAIERFVLTADASRDEDLVRFFHRRVARREALLGTDFKIFKRQQIQSID